LFQQFRSQTHLKEAAVAHHKFPSKISKLQKYTKAATLHPSIGRAPVLLETPWQSYEKQRETEIEHRRASSLGNNKRIESYEPDLVDTDSSDSLP